MERVFIGLGSNLAEPIQQLRHALASIAKIPQTELLRCSSFYRSAPVGPGDQPDYINAVAELETELAALQLLEQLQRIENAQGRERTVRWGARTLDLDILLFGPQRIDEPRLQVPHPRMAERNFVLLPLAELEPDLQLPSGESIQTLLQRCPPNRLEKI
ncbi:2-amino-4-hydroxy-6-hydroxymethyldihydropteridine diphosphokinase [Microbulbifer thermotolerans]|uniref:2-amino-4-hydroxy-6-hydroxymethyldihydropteridine pyrophosphokinase n=1 Tax=Microbulbifer thermotolerans TaxID=252514 RepID=A0A143HJI1_MICTH|nr:2-amino-4-hydroxy-6-hydroxymethyldihydropteridine diphosphokinase [Microbulbifer thermotolerans]AMX01884.1 2-amino-4-hydroxy-6-hydroxymethyldihydropteridine pyrophosphokinase [Microbulbifer thermotolerans]MCX2779220.1 2-amino-4-hydroxy-6-hydroxymethyldihydropteridine diphosphokinase [Microbulbifer thermotolerans]MCX2793550.1 2-amino-4-hydroxy-6-hydroxymethyldihydropteridine diphosphokinase [Microbulbifer thermotolerans]MCX2801580.1 2-amino-4-hydroxy-6-hydroxymethyldihydropteridine diphosphok